MNIKKYRLAAGLSQSQLLKDCPHGISIPLLSAMENGLCAPTRAFCLWVKDKCRKEANGLRADDSTVITADCRASSLRRLDRNTREIEILGVLDAPLTAREVAARLGYTDLNTVKPRLTELKNAGLVEVAGTKKDPVTDRRVSVFRRIG